MTTALRARDTVKLRTLRSIIAAVQEAQVAGDTARTLDDAEVQKVIAAQLKRRHEAAEAFDAGNRPEKAAEERAEAEILAGYLPQALDDDALVTLIDQVLAEGGFTTKADMGRAMKAVNAAVDGRADGRRVADLVKSRLSS